MSTFIRRYSKYLNEKAVSYRQMAFDFCKVRRGLVICVYNKTLFVLIMAIVSSSEIQVSATVRHLLSIHPSSVNFSFK